MTTSGPPNLISEYSRQLRIGEYATTTGHVAKNKTAKTLDKRLQTFFILERCKGVQNV